jgi:hypothetical protein
VSAGAERLGSGGIFERNLLALELDSPEALPASLRVDSPRFACVIAWDARGVEADRIGRFARKLLDAGAVYVCAWGPDCERVHDIFDEEEVGPNPPPEVDRVVMTTWHANESLAEAIWFVLFNSYPDRAYESGCDSTLGIAIGSGPNEFYRRVLGS